MPAPSLTDSRLPEKPFRLGTTSFIFPDHIIPNVKKLGSFFDEIELLCFESRPKDVLPSTAEIKELSRLSDRLNLTYNIHLPTDISLSCGTLEQRQKAVKTLLKVMELFSPLTPTTYTLHLEMPDEVKKNPGNQKIVNSWVETIGNHLGDLVSDNFHPEQISIETLDYPFFLVETLIRSLNLSVCIDAGHQIKYGHNLLETVETHRSKTPVIHLHGVSFSDQKTRDHTGLDLLPVTYAKQIYTILKQFTGVVSLEVFNLAALNQCLLFLSKSFKDIDPIFPFPESCGTQIKG